MNYLAHFHLSFEHPDLVLGNLAGDVVKADDWQSFPEGLACGIRLHRAIDFFTDTHRDTKALVQRLRPFAGRFAGPVSDILRDHLLSQTWELFSHRTLDAFSNQMYDILSRRGHELPPILHVRIEKMVAQRWLSSYQTLEGLEYVFQKFAPRLPPQTMHLTGLMDFICRHHPNLKADFVGFYDAPGNMPSTL